MCILRLQEQAHPEPRHLRQRKVRLGSKISFLTPVNFKRVQHTSSLELWPRPGFREAPQSSSPFHSRKPKANAYAFAQSTVGNVGLGASTAARKCFGSCVCWLQKADA